MGESLMYNIALIYPLKHNKFYINPFYIQKIHSFLVEQKFSNPVSVNVIDVNINQSEHLLCSNHYQLSIIDTPEGSLDALENILNEIDTNIVLLIGDTIKYGKAKDLLDHLKDKYPFTFCGCTEDSSVIEFVALQLSQSSIKDLSGLMYYRMDQFVTNNSRDAFPDKETKKIPLIFTSEIIEEYEKSGIQIFMDGLSRGCENRCAFCKLSNNSMVNNLVHFSRIDVVKTICSLREKITKKLFVQFTDENFFGGGKGRLKQIIKLSDDLASINFKGALGIDTRLDTFFSSNKHTEINELRKKAWEKFYSCGLRYCFLGLESFSKTQSTRYNKNLDLSIFESAITFFKENGIIFTIGLILWDPMMKKEELIENLNFIKDNKLIGNTASLLKVMRIQANSQYLNQLDQKIKYRSSDFFNVNEDNIKYIDSVISKIIPFINSIYKIFNDNGYRHSDVALFSVLYTKNTPIIFKEIPVKISQMEYNILEFLLETNNFSKTDDIFLKLYDYCLSVVNEIVSEMNRITVSDDLNAIFNYYIKVFSKIRIRLSSEINNFKF